MIALTSATTALNYTILNDCTATQNCIELLRCLVAGLHCVTATHIAVSTALDYRTLHCITTLILLLPHLDSPPDVSRLRFLLLQLDSGAVIHTDNSIQAMPQVTLYSHIVQFLLPAHTKPCPHQCLLHSLQFLINIITNTQCLHAGVLTSQRPTQCPHWQSYGWAYCRC